jgi:hypothetical protein
MLDSRAFVNYKIARLARIPSSQGSSASRTITKSDRTQAGRLPFR